MFIFEGSDFLIAECSKSPEIMYPLAEKFDASEPPHTTLPDHAAVVAESVSVTGSGR